MRRAHGLEVCLVEQAAQQRRRWPALAASLAMQAAAVASLLLVPLVATGELPRVPWSTRVFVPPAGSPDAPARAAGGAPGKAATTAPENQSDVPDFIQPIRIPEKTHDGPLDPAAEYSSATDGPPGVSGVPGSAGSGVPHGIPGGVFGPPANLPEPPPVVEGKRLRVSTGALPGRLVHRVAPEYPAIAKQIRLEGTVRLRVVVGRDGRVREVKVLEGAPVLALEAERAVWQWRYEPTLLNGEPVEVEGTIEVVFRLH